MLEEGGSSVVDTTWNNPVYILDVFLCGENFSWIWSGVEDRRIYSDWHCRNVTEGISSVLHSVERTIGQGLAMVDL